MLNLFFKCIPSYDIKLEKKRIEEYNELLKIIPEELHSYTFSILPELSSGKRFRTNNIISNRYNTILIAYISSKFSPKDNYVNYSCLKRDINKDLLNVRIYLDICLHVFDNWENKSTSTAHKLNLMIDGVDYLIEMLKYNI